MIKQRTLNKIFGGQVWNTGEAMFSTGEAHAWPIKQLKNTLEDEAAEMNCRRRYVPARLKPVAIESRESRCNSQVLPLWLKLPPG